MDRLFFRCTLVIFALFIALGNLFRLVQSSLFSDSLIISEAFLYISTFASSFFLPLSSKDLLRFLIAVLGISTSFFYGWYLQGWDVHACLYAARLIALLGTISILSKICFIWYKGSIRSFFSYLCKAYAVSLILGFFLYIFFPESEKLWLWLENHHVGFQGDPHIGRFVSVYFDPNYYSCIAILAFLLSDYLYRVTKKFRYQILSFLFLLSGFLTWSRSGIALLGAVLLYKGWIFLKRKTVSSKGIYLACFILFFGCGYIVVYQEELGIFLERTFRFFEDQSAVCRWKTFTFGLELIQRYPLFGVGINFLYQYTVEEIGLNSIDSSLLALLVQVGIVPFIFLWVYAAQKSVFLKRLSVFWKKVEPEAPHFFALFFLYGLGVFLFASQFNNLLFYPFWILPFGVISLFLTRRAKDKIPALLLKEPEKSLGIGLTD